MAGAVDVLGAHLGTVRCEGYTSTGVSDLQRLLAEAAVGNGRGAVLSIRRPQAPPACLSQAGRPRAPLLLDGPHRSSKGDNKSFTFSSENKAQRLIGELE